MRTKQILVLLIVILLPMSGCFDFYESPGESLHEHFVQHSEPENNEGSEEEEEVDMDVEEIQGVNYAIHDGIARDVKTGTVMGPVGSPVSDTNVSKWGVNVALHLKNMTENMATQ